MSPAGNFFVVLYHKLQTQSSAPEDGRNYRPKLIELVEITNKLLLLYLVCCLYYCNVIVFGCREKCMCVIISSHRRQANL